MKPILSSAAVLILSTLTLGHADELPSGLYAMSWEGEGRVVKRADTHGQIILREHLSNQFRDPSLVSTRNDNSEFRLALTVMPALNLSARPEGADRRPHVVVIAGHAMPVSSHSDPQPDGSISVSGTLQGLDAAKAVAAELGVEPHLRTHPGHQLMVTFEPEQPSYEPDEPVTLRMSITNVGQTTVRFQDGGSQRGPRNNQFAFIAAPALPDVGDPTNFGGLAGLITLAPGETFTKNVTLTDWFHFDQPGVFQITGIYRLTLQDESDDYFRSRLWDDFAIDKCIVRIIPPPDLADLER